MKFNKLLLLLPVILLSTSLFAQNGNAAFRRLLSAAPYEKAAFCINNETGLLEKLLNDKTVIVKSVTPEFIFIQATPQWIDEAKTAGKIGWFHFETGMPRALADTARAKHFVDQVHNGQFGLQTSFTGKDVVIGYVDQGLDYAHPDFIDENGMTRVLWYWDHTLPNDPDHTPVEFGYGQAWTQEEIQNGTSISTENSSAHGTTVAGMGSGNGRANGTNKGMAPDSKIIIVETNFDLPNWTLTVADACNFIFTKAAELGMPAVVNLSVGDYLGSHDGNDPASILIETMLDAQPGRIVVCAAGNSGALGKYHVHNEVDSDTSFTWFRNNPSGSLGNNTVYFDVWSDSPAATWQYAIGANLNSGNYGQRGSTVFRPATFSSGAMYRDTIWNGSNRIATIEFYPETANGNFHLEVYVSHVDSTDYNYSFRTTGSGSYDLWSGTGLGLNAIVSNVPSSAIMPQIVHYVQPDTLQTIVSAWNCSEKVISVGNIRNRFGHYDNNGNYWQPASGSAVGQLSFNSSKGPNRHNVIKPDISAGGDGSLSAGPLWLLTNPAYNSLIDSGGWHVRNGGTSMASPVIAGIAALYLEKCRLGTYQTFKDALTSTAMTDGFTGPTPNNGYGYGKVHALNLMLQSNYNTAISGPLQLCSDPATLTAVSTGAPESWSWSNGENTEAITVSTGGNYSVMTLDGNGCVSYSDTVALAQGDVPAVPTISLIGSQLVTQPYPQLQWYENGSAIPGATGTSITVTVPVISDYTVIATGMTGCESESGIFNQFTGIEELAGNALICYPNPFDESITLTGGTAFEKWTLTDMQGKVLEQGGFTGGKIDMHELSSGAYFIEATGDAGTQRLKIVRK
jgi:hypothetical protein